MKKLLCLFICSCFLLTACGTQYDNISATSESQESIPSKLYEENKDVSNSLNQAFTVDGVSNVLKVKFNTETNTYIVISYFNDSSKITSMSKDEWATLTSSLSGLSGTALETVQNYDSSANIKVIFTSKNDNQAGTPFVCFDNDSLVFDFFNSEKSEQIQMLLETMSYSTLVGNIEVSYDDSKKSYIVKSKNPKFSKDDYLSDTMDDFRKAVTNFSIVLKNVTSSLDPDAKIEVNIYGENNVRFLAAENGDITYNCAD